MYIADMVWFDSVLYIVTASALVMVSVRLDSPTARYMAE
jgi:hypothetical protein